MLFSLVFAGLLIIACVIDLKVFRIPNAIPLALIALFLIKSAAAGNAEIWPGHLMAFGLTFGLGLLAFALGMFGGGDAKLMTALALWFGMAGLPGFLVITAISGGLLALFLLGLRHLANRQPVMASSSGSTNAPKLLDRRAPVPYALPITFAALWLEWQHWHAVLSLN